jgi:hypothetical protein
MDVLLFLGEGLAIQEIVNIIFSELLSKFLKTNSEV